MVSRARRKNLVTRLTKLEDIIQEFDKALDLLAANNFDRVYSCVEQYANDYKSSASKIEQELQGINYED